MVDWAKEEWRLFVQAIADRLAETGQRPPSGILYDLEHSFVHHQVHANGLRRTYMTGAGKLPALL